MTPCLIFTCVEIKKTVHPIPHLTHRQLPSFPRPSLGHMYYSLLMVVSPVFLNVLSVFLGIVNEFPNARFCKLCLHFSGSPPTPETSTIPHYCHFLPPLASPIPLFSAPPCNHRVDRLAPSGAERTSRTRRSSGDSA